MSDPSDENGGIASVGSVTVHLPLAVLEHADRVAAYRNALADAKKIRLERRWSRKLVLESWCKSQSNASQQSMAEMFEELGPLPSADDKKAMQKYAAAVVAWNKKIND